MRITIYIAVLTYLATKSTSDWIDLPITLRILLIIAFVISAVQDIKEINK
jgi:hypothetical protein